MLDPQTFDPQIFDPMQIVFNGAEAVQDALHSQEGCELALRVIFTQITLPDRQCEHMILSLIDSLAHFRTTACAEVQRLQSVSVGPR